MYKVYITAIVTLSRSIKSNIYLNKANCLQSYSTDKIKLYNLFHYTEKAHDETPSLISQAKHITT